ncbi:MAG: hypothetical protein JWR27_662 [Aeromicrobium sp.]|nr:hypothetical protein [Aeromicrobium sp.]
MLAGEQTLAGPGVRVTYEPLGSILSIQPRWPTSSPSGSARGCSSPWSVTRTNRTPSSDRGRVRTCAPRSAARSRRLCPRVPNSWRAATPVDQRRDDPQDHAESPPRATADQERGASDAYRDRHSHADAQPLAEEQGGEDGEEGREQVKEQRDEARLRVVRRGEGAGRLADVSHAHGRRRQAPAQGRQRDLADPERRTQDQASEAEAHGQQPPGARTVLVGPHSEDRHCAEGSGGQGDEPCPHQRSRLIADLTCRRPVLGRARYPGETACRARPRDRKSTRRSRSVYITVGTV